MKTKTQSEKVFQFILEQLKSGSWKTGDKIFTETEFCERFGVSRVVVREAIEKCVALGLLYRRKGAGTFVSEYGIASVINTIAPLLTLKSADVMEVLSFRYYFEPGNVREFVGHCDDRDIARLEETYREMKENIDDQRAFYLADYNFHDIIAKGTKNPIVIEISEILKEVLVNAQESVNYTIGPEVGLKYHRQIIHALRERDEELAALMMERHIRSTMVNIQQNAQGKLLFMEVDNESHRFKSSV